MKTFPLGIGLALVIALPTVGSTQEEDRLRRSLPDEAGSPAAPLLIGIGVHIEPNGAVVSSQVEGAGGRKHGKAHRDYGNPDFFRRHLEDLRTLVTLVERHEGKLTVQTQTPFTRMVVESGESFLADLERRGHEVGLHFHENAHLGRDSATLPVSTWAAVMREELAWIHRAGARDLRYWSGGNLYGGVLEAAALAGLSVMGDYKNPATQGSAEVLMGIHPWRPSGGPGDLGAFAAHSPAEPIVFLPCGSFSRLDYASIRRSMADAAYFDFLTEGLELSLRAARPDRVNVFRVTVHPGEFRGNDGRPFAIVEEWLRRVVAPLMRTGKARWATYGEMADAFRAWEAKNPEVDPRLALGRDPGPTNCRPAQGDPTAYLTFAINVHDILHVDESADTVLRLIGLFERNGVRGDFYVTAPMIELYVERRPDVIAKLKSSEMGISYHVRPPHPLYHGFDASLADLDDRILGETLRDYETYRLDLATGGLDRSRPGGYEYVKAVMGRAPVAAPAPNRSPRVKNAAERVYRQLGARMTIAYHETGTKVDSPWEWRNGLLIRPSDFSITRWGSGPGSRENFWWNRIGRGHTSENSHPLARLQEELADWDGPRPPFVTSLIHENNFYRSGATPFANVYWTNTGKEDPRTPPFDLNAPDPSTGRSREEREAIWTVYGEMVAYAARGLRVVTSEDLVELAGE